MVIQDPDRDVGDDNYSAYSLVEHPQFEGDWGLSKFGEDQGTWWFQSAITLCPVCDPGATLGLMLTAAGLMSVARRRLGRRSAR
jgi:hypothetical protein